MHRKIGRSGDEQSADGSAIATPLFAPAPVRATAPFADSRLSVVTGLQLWLDANRAAGDQQLPDDHTLAVCKDAPGNDRDVQQEKGGSAANCVRREQ